MSAQPPLPFPHEHDLPPKWDGHPITWDPQGWRDGLILNSCHIPRDPCVQCGATGERCIRGWITQPEPPHIGLAAFNRWGPPVIIHLWVHRCTTCGLDTVITHGSSRVERWQVWELGPEDYGDEGSRG